VIPSKLPPLRLRAANAAPVRADGDFVLYWMSSTRRLVDNFALERAIELARALGRPLLVFEGLRAGYRWASDRHHQFVLDGMAEHAAALADARVAYFPWVERRAGEGRGLLEALAGRAAAIVTDDWPCFFLPRAIAKLAAVAPVQLEQVDSCGLVPLRAVPKPYPMAVFFRGFLRKNLAPHLAALPAPRPLDGLALPPLDPRVLAPIEARWPRATPALLAGGAALAELEIDHRVAPVALRGGTRAAEAKFVAFLERGLARYAGERSDPDAEAASGLSPHLHYGHLGVHGMYRALLAREPGGVDALVRPPPKSDDGDRIQWGWSPAGSAFFDELVTWRELGLNTCHHRPDDYDRWESLPEWARNTLDAHKKDARPYTYDRATLDAAATHEPLWNAAQRELLETGVMQNYLRMLWGKMTLLWSKTPREALETLVELNNRYALDGRDPNSYSGIFWVFGRYDRPWPERDVFGVVRSMSPASTAKKLKMTRYLKRFGATRALF
jgi:deoxyribodipyrimidine photo-lyase